MALNYSNFNQLARKLKSGKYYANKDDFVAVNLHDDSQQARLCFGQLVLPQKLKSFGNVFASLAVHARVHVVLRHLAR